MAREITALRLESHGAPLRLERVPLRDPGPEEVVVELVAAAVNPVDSYGAEGRVAADGPLPRTLGGEAAGFVDGNPVLVNGGGLGTMTDGVWAEAVTAPREALTPLSPRADLTAAAGLGVAGITAWNTVIESANVTAQDRVLVLGAGGGVGLSIVCLALSLGAKVLGQVGSEPKAEAVRAYGAQATVADADSLPGAAGGFAPTVVFDPLGGEFTGAALSILAPRGRHVVFGTSAGAEVQLSLRAFYRTSQRLIGYGGLSLTPAERGAGARAAVTAFEDGRLKVHVGRVLALSAAENVFDALADRSLAGKLVIDCTR
jgi:NADPH2:quinone reductase